MMRTPVYRPRASFDLESIVIYVGEVLGMHQSAKRLFHDVVEEVNALCDMPHIGRPFFDEALERKNYRTHLVGQHRIFYSFDKETLTVWRIVHTRQDIDDYALIDWFS